MKGWVSPLALKTRAEHPISTRQCTIFVAQKTDKYGYKTQHSERYQRLLAR